VPDDKIDQEINSLDDLTEYQKKGIQEFFEIYKRLEPNKLVKITGFESKEVAEQSKSWRSNKNFRRFERKIDERN